MLSSLKNKSYIQVKSRKYYLQNREAILKRNRPYYLLKRRQLRLSALEKLGNQCARCGFKDVRALQIDHINGGGELERKILSQYQLHKKVLAGTTEYQLLCANCNFIKLFEDREKQICTDGEVA